MIFLSNFYMDFYFYFLFYSFLNKYLHQGIDNKTVKHKNDQKEQFKGQANLVNT